jgi:subtilisin family serine protease
MLQVDLPASAVDAVADSPAIDFVRTPSTPEQTEYVSEGLGAINATTPHNQGITGDNVTVAVLDLGFDATNPEIANNVVNVRDEDGSSFSNTSDQHGTAVAELVVDTAPNVSLELIKTQTGVEIASAADYIDNQSHIDAVAMSLGINTGPFDGTSPLDDRVATSIDRGTPWFVSSGNAAGGKHLTTSWNDPNGDDTLNFSGNDQVMEITPPSNGQVDLTISWNDYYYSNEDYNVKLYDGNGNSDIGNTVQDGNQRPEEKVSINTEQSTAYLEIYNADANGTATFQIFGNDGVSFEYYTKQQSITRPATEEKVFTVGAVYYDDLQIESFSSRGPTQDGRRGVDFVAPDGVTTDVYDSTGFYGTSAAAPHAAGVAALYLDATDRQLSVSELNASMKNSATSLSANEPNPTFGYGLVNATGAVTASSPSSVAADRISSVTADSVDTDATSGTANFTVALNETVAANVTVNLSDNSVGAQDIADVTVVNGTSQSTVTNETVRNGTAVIKTNESGLLDLAVTFDDKLNVSETVTASINASDANVSTDDSVNTSFYVDTTPDLVDTVSTNTDDISKYGTTATGNYSVALDQPVEANVSLGLNASELTPQNITNVSVITGSSETEISNKSLLNESAVINTTAQGEAAISLTFTSNISTTGFFTGAINQSHPKISETTNTTSSFDLTVLNNAPADLTASNTTSLAGTNTTVNYTLENTQSTNSSYILNISTPSRWTIAAHSDDGGNWQSNGSKWLWQTIEPGGTVSPAVTVSVPDNLNGSYRMQSTVLTNISVVTERETTVSVLDLNLTASLEEQTIANGSVTTMTVRAPQSNGSFANVTDSATFNSTDSEIATVDQNGTVTGEGTGTTSISAAYQDSNDSVTVTVEPASVTQAIDTNNDREIGDTEILSAIEYWQLNDPVPRTDGETIGDLEVLQLIEIWRTNGKL